MFIARLITIFLSLLVGATAFASTIDEMVVKKRDEARLAAGLVTTKKAVTDDMRLLRLFGKKGEFFADIDFSGSKLRVKKGSRLGAWQVSRIDREGVTLNCLGQCPKKKRHLDLSSNLAPEDSRANWIKIN